MALDFHVIPASARTTVVDLMTQFVVNHGVPEDKLPVLQTRFGIEFDKATTGPFNKEAVGFIMMTVVNSTLNAYEINPPPYDIAGNVNDVIHL